MDQKFVIFHDSFTKVVYGDFFLAAGVIFRCDTTQGWAVAPWIYKENWIQEQRPALKQIWHGGETV